MRFPGEKGFHFSRGFVHISAIGRNFGTGFPGFRVLPETRGNEGGGPLARWGRRGRNRGAVCDLKDRRIQKCSISSLSDCISFFCSFRSWLRSGRRSSSGGGKQGRGLRRLRSSRKKDRHGWRRSDCFRTGGIIASGSRTRGRLRPATCTSTSTTNPLRRIGVGRVPSRIPFRSWDRASRFHIGTPPGGPKETTKSLFGSSGRIVLVGEWNGQFYGCRRRRRDVEGTPAGSSVLEMTRMREDLPPALPFFPLLSFLLPSFVPGAEFATEPLQGETGH